MSTLKSVTLTVLYMNGTITVKMFSANYITIIST